MGRGFGTAGAQGARPAHYLEATTLCRLCRHGLTPGFRVRGSGVQSGLFLRRSKLFLRGWSCSLGMVGLGVGAAPGQHPCPGASSDSFLGLSHTPTKPLSAPFHFCPHSRQRSQTLLSPQGLSSPQITEPTRRRMDALGEKRLWVSAWLCGHSPFLGGLCENMDMGSFS